MPCLTHLTSARGVYWVTEHQPKCSPRCSAKLLPPVDTAHPCSLSGGGDGSIWACSSRNVTLARCRLHTQKLRLIIISYWIAVGRSSGRQLRSSSCRSRRPTLVTSHCLQYLIALVLAFGSSRCAIVRGALLTHRVLGRPQFLGRISTNSIANGWHCSRCLWTFRKPSAGSWMGWRRGSVP